MLAVGIRVTNDLGDVTPDAKFGVVDSLSWASMVLIVTDYLRFLVWGFSMSGLRLLLKFNQMSVWFEDVASHFSLLFYAFLILMA